MDMETVMFEIALQVLMTCVAVVGGLVAVILILYAIVRTCRQIRTANHALRLQTARGKLQAMDFHFYYNLESDVMAVCNSYAFEAGVVEHLEKVESGGIKPWEKVVVYAKPTFTFASSEATRRPIHTGTRSQFEDYVGQIIFNQTRVRRDELSEKEFLWLGSAISRRDSRLFVPFVGSVPNAGDQMSRYGATTLNEFKTSVSP